MSTDLYPDQKLTEPADEWRSSLETAPSQVRADEPKLARFIAMCSASVLILSLFIFLMHARDNVTILGPLLGQFVAWTGAVLGVGGLLYHAARDKDEQVRFMYMLLGYALIAGGVIASLVPREGQVGHYFLPFAVPAFALGLLFQLAYVRHETDEFYARTTRQVLGGLGAAMALWGFIQGSVSLDFLLPQGILLALLGLVYLTMFVALEGVASDLGYRVAQGIGLIGGVICLLAVGRAALISYGTLSAESGFHFMPGGVVLLALGFLYLAVFAAYCWDNVVVVLAQREFVRYFYSPIAYAVLVGFTLIGWVMFMQFVFGQLLARGGPSPVIEPAVGGYIVSWFSVICVIILVPVVTMGSLSEEQRTGTLEVMLTSPVNEPAVVVSKVLGALLFYLLIWIPWGLYLVALRVEGGQPFDYRPVLGFYVVLACTGLNFLSMGVFFSSLTRNQIVAAVLTFAGMLGLLLMFFLKDNVFEPDSPVGLVLTHVGFIDLWIDSLRGKVAPRDLLLHVSAAIFWCFLTVKVLESRKWR